MDMKHINKTESQTADQGYSSHPMDRSHLRADCEHCSGLCCVALHFSASEGFPVDKIAGQPCLNLQTDFRCSVHHNLREEGLKGCIAFDCLGAGPKVTQIIYSGYGWREHPETAQQMFEAFLIMRQLHELLWYINDALEHLEAHSIHDALASALFETEKLTDLDVNALSKLDVDTHRKTVNQLLLQTSDLVRTVACQGKKGYAGRRKTFGRGADLIGADLRKTDLKGANLRGAYLIAADLRGVDLTGADLIGADFRDTDLSGADLSASIFLNQPQIHVAKGDSRTKLPSYLTRPAHWINE